MKKVTFHPLATIFPLVDGDEFAALVEDIREHGLREPIVLFDDMVLDGRNRLRACKVAGVEPQFVEYEGDNPLAYVISLNLRRRHLDESQRAMVAAKIATLKDGQRQVGQLAEVPTQEQAAAMLNVGERSVRRARKVVTEGTPELVDAVARGEIAVSTAATWAQDPPETQRAAVMRIMCSSESVEWYTPRRIVEDVTRFLRAIDLDPAWHEASPVVASATYTAADDGLAMPWLGRVYLNPPYGKTIDAWIAKLIAEFEKGNVTEAVALVPARTDTVWWGRLDDFPRCFVRGRLTFHNAENPPPFPNALVYLGRRVKEFAKAFDATGPIFVKYSLDEGEVAETTVAHPLDIPPELRRAAP